MEETTRKSLDLLWVFAFFKTNANISFTGKGCKYCAFKKFVVNILKNILLSCRKWGIFKNKKRETKKFFIGMTIMLIN